MGETRTRDEGFIARLEALRDAGDRGALAVLRKGLGNSVHPPVAMHPYVAPFTASLHGWSEDVFYLVAALFASHPLSAREGSFGRTARLIAEARAERNASFEKRFLALLDTASADLPHHLRQFVSLARAAEVPVNWVLLLRDLRAWDAMDRWVQRAWARDFYQSTLDPSSQGSTQAEAAGTADGGSR